MAGVRKSQPAIRRRRHAESPVLDLFVACTSTLTAPERRGATTVPVGPVSSVMLSSATCGDLPLWAAYGGTFPPSCYAPPSAARLFSDPPWRRYTGIRSSGAAAVVQPPPASGSPVQASSQDAPLGR